MQDWLNRYGFDVELNRRGFRIETPCDGVHNVIIIKDNVKILKHITLADVHRWLGQRIRKEELTISGQAKADFNGLGSWTAEEGFKL